MEEQACELNPSIRELKYGKKEIKTLTLYPLSIGDQFKVTNMITAVVKELVPGGGRPANVSDFAFMTAVLNGIEGNIEKILCLISDISVEKAKEVLSQLTNSQFMDLVESVWTVDYEPSIKKGVTLFARGRSAFLLKGSSPDSSSPIPPID